MRFNLEAVTNFKKNMYTDVYRHVGVRGSVVSVLTELTSSTTLICALEPHHDLDSRTPTPTQTIVSRMNSNVTSWVTDFERRSLPARST